MKGCWDPEFEPSVEETVDYPMISFWRFFQFAFSSELAFRAGGFPYSVEHMAGEGQPAQAARPNMNLVMYRLTHWYLITGFPPPATEHQV